MAKATFTKLITPKGVAQYPWITKPDTRFNPDGVYTIRLVLPEAEAQTVIDKIDAEIEKAVKEAVENAKTPGDAKKIKKADPPYVMEEDEDGNETGNVIFKFKQNAIIKAKSGDVFPAKVNIFDAQGKEAKGISVYGGSEVKVAAELAPYYSAMDKAAGVSMRLKAVQVIRLVSGSGGDASSYGFGKEEGFSYHAEDEEPPFNTDGIEEDEDF